MTDFAPATDDLLRAIRRALLRFYQRNARDLPWRRKQDPYAIWIAEVMLQQTQVATALPRYGEFLRRFPSVRALAAAGPERVCEAWAGLGYYRRARNLHAAACRMVAEHESAVPRELDALTALPGIGAYTAGAIASIAFGASVPAVDANAVRVLARLFAITATPARTRSRVQQIAAHLAAGTRAGEVNQALMDLGATVCRPRQPGCERCPLRRRCAARRQGRATEHPTRAKPAVRRDLEIAFAWIETNGAVWLERRGLDGLWAGLWQLPGCEGPSARRELARRLGCTLGRPLAEVRYLLTHRTVHARVYKPSQPRRLRAGPSLRPFADPFSAALSTLARRAVLAVSSPPPTPIDRPTGLQPIRRTRREV